MIKISELLKQEEIPAFINRVHVDDFVDYLPKEIQSIGVLYDGGPDNLSLDCMDFMTLCNLAGKECILEIPCETNIDVKYVVNLCAQTQCSFSLLPPEHLSQESMKLYKDRLKAFTEGYLNQPNFVGQAIPITGYLQYMFTEVVANVEKYVPHEEYVILEFSDKLSEHFSDDFKRTIRAAILEHFGGPDEFKEFTLSVMNNAYDQADSIAKTHGMTGEGGFIYTILMDLRDLIFDFTRDIPTPSSVEKIKSKYVDENNRFTEEFYIDVRSAIFKFSGRQYRLKEMMRGLFNDTYTLLEDIALEKTKFDFDPEAVPVINQTPETYEDRELLIPIVITFQSLVQEMVEDIKEPLGFEIVETFTNSNGELNDLFYSVTRHGLADHFNGREEFIRFAREMIASVYAELEKNAQNADANEPWLIQN